MGYSDNVGYRSLGAGCSENEPDRRAAMRRSGWARWEGAPLGCRAMLSKWWTGRGLLSIGCLCALLAGCAHETATTTIRSDGGWTRKSVLSMAQGDSGAPGKTAKTMKLEDIFVPPSGQGWKIERKLSGEQPKQDVLTAVKEVHAGESISGDLTVKAGAKKGQAQARVVNLATVRAAGPGKWVYTETFHWLGVKPSIGKDMLPLFKTSLKGALPAPLALPQNDALLAKNLQPALWSALFSPPEPLLLEFYDNLVPIPAFSDPEERTSLLVRRLGPVIESTLNQTFGARMSAGQRRATALKIARQIALETSAAAGTGDKMGGSAGKSPGTDSATESFGGMYPVAISLIVKIPGRVIRTNGRVDDLTGEIYWTLYPQAALQQDVTLRAEFETTAGGQASLR